MDTPVEGVGPVEEVREQANSWTAPPITTGGPCSLLVKHSCRNCSRQKLGSGCIQRHRWYQCW